MSTAPHDWTFDERYGNITSPKLQVSTNPSWGWRPYTSSYPMAELRPGGRIWRFTIPFEEGKNGVYVAASYGGKERFSQAKWTRPAPPATTPDVWCDKIARVEPNGVLQQYDLRCGMYATAAPRGELIASWYNETTDKHQTAVLWSGWTSTRSWTTRVIPNTFEGARHDSTIFITYRINNAGGYSASKTSFKCEVCTIRN